MHHPCRFRFLCLALWLCRTEREVLAIENLANGPCITYMTCMNAWRQRRSAELTRLCCHPPTSTTSVSSSYCFGQILMTLKLLTPKLVRNRYYCLERRPLMTPYGFRLAVCSSGKSASSRTTRPCTNYLSRVRTKHKMLTLVNC